MALHFTSTQPNEETEKIVDEDGERTGINLRFTFSIFCVCVLPNGEHRAIGYEVLKQSTSSSEAKALQFKFVMFQPVIFTPL